MKEDTEGRCNRPEIMSRFFHSSSASRHFVHQADFLFFMVFVFALPICGHACVWSLPSACAVCVSVTTTVCFRNKLKMLELLVGRV